MTAPLSLAMIGCGGMGRRHVHGLAELASALRRVGRAPLLRLTAVADRDGDRAEALANETAALLGERPTVVADLDDAIRANLAEAVDVNTATESHHLLAVAAAEARLHLFVEKPLAATIRGASAAIEAAARAEVTLAVAENVRREPVNRFAHALIRAGAIGEVRFVLDLLLTGGDAILLTPWRHRRVTGGMLLDVGVHHADVLEYLAGPVATVTGTLRLDEPVRVRQERSPVASATFYEPWRDDLPERVAADAEDVALALLDFASGATGQWTLHHATHGQRRALRLICGSEGTLDLPPDRSGGPPVLTTSGGDRLDGRVLLDRAPDYCLNDLEAAIWGEARLSHSAGDFATIDRKLVAVEFADFARAVRDRRAPEVGGETARRNMALAYAVAESVTDGRPIAVADVERGAVHAYQDAIDRELGLLEAP